MAEVAWKGLHTPAGRRPVLPLSLAEVRREILVQSTDRGRYICHRQARLAWFKQSEGKEGLFVTNVQKAGPSGNRRRLSPG